MTTVPSITDWPRNARYAVVAEWGEISAVVYAEVPSAMRATAREFIQTLSGDVRVTSYDETGRVVQYAYRETKTRH